VTIRWKAQLGSEELRRLKDLTTKSIEAIFGQISGLGPYEPGDAQKAKTRVVWPPDVDFTSATKDQEHSEMVGLGEMLPNARNLWDVSDAGTVVADNGHPIGGGNYWTDLPHCGHCTILLHVLELPLTEPTNGRYNFASHLNYVLPPEVRESLPTLALLVNKNQNGGGEGYVVVKRMVNAFISTPTSEMWVLELPWGKYVTDEEVVDQQPGGTEVLEWKEAKVHSVDVNEPNYGKAPLLIILWKLVYAGILANVT